MLLLAMAAATAPLAPVGKWNMRYEDNSCILARLYGDEKKPVTIGWRAIPLLDSIEILITEPRGRQDFRRGDVDVDIGGQVTSGSFYSYPTSTSGLYMTRITVDRASFAGSDKPVVATVRPKRGHPIAFSVLNSAAAFKALQGCIDDTAKLWGVDPAAQAAIVTKAEPANSEAQWFKVDDYPMSEVKAGQQGISVLLWKVDTLGHVGDCRAVIPSGSALLDKAGCDAITKRGRYTPALDASGKPVTTYRVRKILWSMSGGLARDN